MRATSAARSAASRSLPNTASNCPSGNVGLVTRFCRFAITDSNAGRLPHPQVATDGRITRARLPRVAEIVIQPAQDGVHALQSGESLQINPRVAHREIVALDQRKAELLR